MALVFKELSFSIEYFEEICRICLSKTQILIPISPIALTHQLNGNGTTEVVNLRSVFLKFCGFEISDTDCKPKNICESCLDMLSKAFNFFQKVIWSNQLLDFKINEINHKIEVNIKSDHEYENMSVSDVDCPEFENTDVKFEVIEHDIEDGDDQAVRFEIVPKQSRDPKEKIDEAVETLVGKKKEPQKRKRRPPLKNRVQVTEDGVEIFTCRFCDTEISGLNELVDHCNNEHPDRNRSCALCLYEIKLTTKRPLHLFHMAKKHSTKAIVCDYCSVYFRTQEDLDKHNNMIDHEKKTCLLCMMDFRNTRKSTFGNILSHIDRVHTLTEKNFLCSHCGKAFKYTRNLRRHIEVRHEGKRFLCPTCGAEFGAVNSLNGHLRKVHGAVVHTNTRITRKTEPEVRKRKPALRVTKSFVCPTGHCSRRFGSYYKLYVHADIHKLDFKDYKCQICTHTSVSFADLKQHQVDSHQTHPCASCDEKFVSKADLLHHTRQLTSCRISKKASYRCQYCSKMYESLVRYYFHSRIHSEFKEYLCKVCNEEFDTFPVYSKHYNEHKTHVCSYQGCGKTFISRQQMKFHSYSHTDKIFSCNICGATVNTAPRLQLHIRTVHLNERLFECKKCDKTFKQRSHLSTHQITHGIQKPWKCKNCGLRFLFESLLNSHMRTHTGEKPYKCLYCVRAFRDSTTRHKHIIQAHCEFMDEYLEYRKNQLRKDNAMIEGIEANRTDESEQITEVESRESCNSGDSDYEYKFVDAAEFDDNTEETVVYDDEDIAVDDEEEEYGDNEYVDEDSET